MLAALDLVASMQGLAVAVSPSAPPPEAQSNSSVVPPHVPVVEQSAPVTRVACTNRAPGEKPKNYDASKPSPNGRGLSAASSAVGARELGGNGKMWVCKENKNGIHLWVPVRGA
jgi:hypothetical protein